MTEHQLLDSNAVREKILVILSGLVRAHFLGEGSCLSGVSFENFKIERVFEEQGNRSIKGLVLVIWRLMMSIVYDFSGKNAVVTGGAGILCGEMAKALAKCGASVAIVDKNEEGAKAVIFCSILSWRYQGRG